MTRLIAGSCRDFYSSIAVDVELIRHANLLDLEEDAAIRGLTEFRGSLKNAGGRAEVMLCDAVNL